MAIWRGHISRAYEGEGYVASVFLDDLKSGEELAALTSHKSNPIDAIVGVGRFLQTIGRRDQIEFEDDRGNSVATVETPFDKLMVTLKRWEEI